MNQQRSRRFRSAQEAREKYETRLEAEAEWRGAFNSMPEMRLYSLSNPAMGKEITSEAKEAWDSNAITPGTPFMDLLANSLRYWVVQKLNTDPGWKNVRSILAFALTTEMTFLIDASLPFRRQRPG
jgi:5'-3' exoribonuclease 2